jgi:hypothetical protein
VSVASKLQIKPGQSVAVINQPSDVDLELSAESPPEVDPAAADVVIVFCVDRAELEAWDRPLLAAARRDALSWLAYPKAGKLGTDLNRDLVAQMLRQRGIQPVRQIAVDDTWSALRFRPG